MASTSTAVRFHRSVVGTTAPTPTGRPAWIGPDGGVLAGLYWTTGNWALRASAYICIGSFAGSTVRLVQSGGQLTVQPAQFSIPSGGGVLLVSIAATVGGSSQLSLLVVNRSGKQQLRRVVAAVVADQAHWHVEHAS